MDLQYLAQCTCTNGSVIFDIGGHNGNTAYEIAPYVGSLGKVFTFEPHYHWYNVIQERIATAPPITKNIIPINRALFSSVGFTQFYFGTNPSAEQASSLLAPSTENKKHYGEVRSTTVETDTLDSFTMRHAIAPNLLKIDVEGAEEQVIRGGEFFIKKSQPPIYFEHGSAGNEVSAINTFKTVELLLSFGYRIFLSDIMDFEDKHVWTNRPQTQNLLIPVEFKDFIQLSKYNYNGNSIAVSNFDKTELKSKSNIVSFSNFLSIVFDVRAKSPHIRPQYR
jgi:FkbM family methyltransferase